MFPRKWFQRGQPEMTEVEPSDCTDAQLVGFLRRKGKSIPKSRIDCVRAVTDILRREGRITVLVQTEPSQSASKSVVNALTDMFQSTISLNRDEPVYETVGPERPPPPPRREFQRERFDYKLGYKDESPIGPIPPRAHVITPEYSADSFESVESGRYHPRITHDDNDETLFRQRVSHKNQNKFADAQHISVPREKIEPSQPAQCYTVVDHRQNLQPNFEVYNPRLKNTITQTDRSQLPEGKPDHFRPKFGAIKFKHNFKLGEQNVSDFLSAVKRHADLYAASDREAILLFFSSFSNVGEANMVQDSISEDELENWDLFKTKVLSQYGRTKNEWFSLFEKYSRSPNESCAQTLNKLTVLFRNAIGRKNLTPDNYCTIVRKYKCIIHPTLNAHLESRDITEYACIAQESQKLERAFSIPRVRPATIAHVSGQSGHNNYAAPPPAPRVKFPCQDREKPGCQICELSSHRTYFCFLNPRGPNFKGVEYVTKEISKN